MTLGTMLAELPLAWDSDSRLVDPGIIRSADAFHHRATGTVVACYMIGGAWSDGALTVLHGCLADVLPDRHSSRITSYGEVRVAVAGMANTWTVLRETAPFDIRHRLYP